MRTRQKKFRWILVLLTAVMLGILCVGPSAYADEVEESLNLWISEQLDILQSEIPEGNLIEQPETDDWEELYAVTESSVSSGNSEQLLPEEPQLLREGDPDKQLPAESEVCPEEITEDLLGGEQLHEAEVPDDDTSSGLQEEASADTTEQEVTTAEITAIEFEETIEESLEETQEAPSAEFFTNSEKNVLEPEIAEDQTETLSEEAAILTHEDPEVETEEEQIVAPEPTWVLDIPKMQEIRYGEQLVQLSTAAVSSTENLGDHAIFLTVECTGVFTGEGGILPVTLCFGGDRIEPVQPGEPAIYGIVSNEMVFYRPVYLVFSEEIWAAIASGQYSMTVSYNSYVE